MKISWKNIFTTVFKIFVTATFFSIIFGAHYWGYYKGYEEGVYETATHYEETLKNYVSSEESVALEPTSSPAPTPRPRSTGQVAAVWGGPDLWEAVNQRRKELGVNPLGTKSELCTIASIRLNELLEAGKLDGHEGFSSLPERREDLKWIFETYNISEFLVSGATSADDAVNLWENTLGHKKLLTGGEYVWGCTYAQNTFGVAIAAY